MKIAIASSGLGHVARGIETWAESCAEALQEAGVDVTLFRGSGVASVVLPCLRRGSFLNKVVAGIFHHLGGWRYGLGYDYQVEQTTIAGPLIRNLRDGGYEIAHLQDPWLAWLLEKARRRGRHKARVILAHGTEEPLEFLDRFQYLQELSPHYARRHRNAKKVFCVPNFVNVNEYDQDNGDTRRKLREELGLPASDVIVCSIGAINSGRKRMDWIVSEVARAGKQGMTLVMAGPLEKGGMQIVEAGKARLGESFKYMGSLPREEIKKLYHAADIFTLASLEEIFGITWLEAMACGLPCVGHKFPVTEWILGVREKAESGNGRRNHKDRKEHRDGRQNVDCGMWDVGRGRQNVECGTWNVERGNEEVGGRGQTLRNAAKAAKQEGKPGTLNAEQGTDPGGICVDMTEEGALARVLEQLVDDKGIREEIGKAGRKRVEVMFSKEAVVPRMVEMYGEVLGS